MKKNLFTALLAVALVMALVFVVAPNAKAETGADFTFSADGESYEVNGNCVIDLAGFDVSITVAEGVENPNVVVIDSKNLEDMTGNSAGTLAVNGNCNINDVNLNLVDSYRYLKVDNGGTYSFYPFNMAITMAGVHVKANAISLEVKFVANKVVQDKFIGYGIYKHDGDNAGLYTNVKDQNNGGHVFEDLKYGLRVCFDLTGSLATDMLTKTRTFSAYVEIEGIDGLVIGNQRVGVTPADILNLVNEGYEASSDAQKTLAKVLFWKNPALRAELSNITDALATISVPSTYSTFGDANTSPKNKALDDIISISCNGGTYIGSSGQIVLNTGYNFLIESTLDISKISLNVGRASRSYTYAFEYFDESGNSLGSTTKDVTGIVDIELTDIIAGCKAINVSLSNPSGWGGIYSFTLYREEEGLNCTGHIDKNGEEGGYVCDFCEQPFVPAPPVPDPRTYSNFTGFAANSDDIVTLSKIGNAYASGGKFVLNAGEGLSIESTYNISKIDLNVGRASRSYTYTFEYFDESGNSLGSTTKDVTGIADIELTDVPAGCKAIKITHDQSVWGGVYSFTLTFSN